MSYQSIIARLDNKNPSMFESEVLALIRRLEAEAEAQKAEAERAHSLRIMAKRDYDERGDIIARLERQLTAHGATICGHKSSVVIDGEKVETPPCHWLRIGNEKLCPDCGPREFAKGGPLPAGSYTVGLSGMMAKQG